MGWPAEWELTAVSVINVDVFSIFVHSISSYVMCVVLLWYTEHICRRVVSGVMYVRMRVRLTMNGLHELGLNETKTNVLTAIRLASVTHTKQHHTYTGRNTTSLQQVEIENIAATSYGYGSLYLTLPLSLSLSVRRCSVVGVRIMHIHTHVTYMGQPPRLVHSAYWVLAGPYHLNRSDYTTTWWWLISCCR